MARNPDQAETYLVKAARMYRKVHPSGSNGEQRGSGAKVMYKLALRFSAGDGVRKVRLLRRMLTLVRLLRRMLTLVRLLRRMLTLVGMHTITMCFLQALKHLQ